MSKASKRRRIAARARYRNRLTGDKLGTFAGRWIIQGYSFDDTWYHIRKQGGLRG